ncbi:MAG: radical SAM protein [Candidatus Nanopelagicales bacterium]
MAELRGRPVGLYVHVPFCGSLCPFCPYNKVRYQPGPAGRYLDSLRAEAEVYQAAAPGLTFTSLYVGGGTPTLCLAGLGWLADLPVSGERAIEVLPTHMTGLRADTLCRSGFDAVSVGVQSFDPRVLRHLRRPTTVEGNRRAVALARDRFRCVDVDLIFDVGYDEPDTLLRDLAEAFSYGVDQVSTYPLMRFGYTPFGKAQHDRHAEHRLLRRATELAELHGYHRDSVWTFRREGAPGYTSITRPYYLGLGAGAATFTGESFLLNHFGLAQYDADVTRGELPVALAAHLTGARAALFRAFWQAYTGVLPLAAREDPLLGHPAAGAVAAVAQWLGWVGGSGRVTAVGYDRFHDLERWVTYHLIEPLWAELMAEHRVADAGAAEAALGG